MTPDFPGTDDELFVQLRSGDQDAFLELYRRRQGAVYRFALHMSGSASVAEDVTQDVFLALIRGECRFDPERGTLSGYLFGIARKLILKQIERGRLDVALGTDADPEGALANLPAPATTADSLRELTHRESIEALRLAVLALPRRYREVVVLCDLEELDYVDAAAVLGCPIGTVRSRLHRARALLLEKLTQRRSPRVLISTLKPAGSLI